MDRAASAQLSRSNRSRRAPLWSRPSRTRLYAASRTQDADRSRRATDVVLLVTCVGTMAVLIQLSAPASGIEAALISLADALPAVLDILWRIGIGLASLWSVVLVIASLVRRRWDVLRDHVAALVIAAVIVEWVLQIIGVEGRAFWSGLVASDAPADAVAVRLSWITAVTVVASPHIARPFRSTSRWLVTIGFVSLVNLGATTPSGAALGVACGTAAGAAVHLLFGSSGGRPSLRSVREALDELGVEVTSLSEGTRQPAGVFLLDATDPRGQPLVVKVYGRDAWDTQLLAKAWRALWYRDAEALTLTRLQQAEHEGFATLLAARNGVPTHDVVRAGRSSTNDAVLVLRMRGTPIEPAPQQFDPAVLEGLWDTMDALASAGFAHGDLAPSQLRLDGDEVVVGGLATAALAPTGDQRRVDIAQLIATSAVLAGPEASVDIASRRLGTDGLADVVPYLQTAAIGPVLRAELATGGIDLDDLRERIAVAGDVEEPTLARLRRVSPATLVQAGLLAAAAYFLISTLAGIDTEDLLDALRGASIPVLVLALVFGQLPRLAQAESTRGACPRPIPFGPVVLLQFAITFVNLVIPSTAARVAVSIRFFQRQGIPPAAAVSIGAIDSFAGFIVQVLIIASVTIFGVGTLDLDLDLAKADTGGLLRLVLVAMALVVVAALVALVLPRTRAWVLERIRPWYHDAVETVASLRSPAKVARVLGANLGAEVLFATTLGIAAAAFGQSLPLATLLVINVSVALFAGLMPVPGGIGVAEGALVVGLTAAGVDEATAFGITIAYRMCTFYLPPIWGGVAFHRMERSGLL